MNQTLDTIVITAGLELTDSTQNSGLSLRCPTIERLYMVYYRAVRERERSHTCPLSKRGEARRDFTLALLGHILAHNKIYLVDHDINVYAYSLSLAVVEYQTAIPCGDIDAATDCHPATPALPPSSLADTVYANSEQHVLPSMGPSGGGTRTMTVIRIWG